MNKYLKSNPPRLAQFIMRLVARSEHEQYLIGDLQENYDRIRNNKGIVSAQFWYWYQCLLTFPRGLYNQIYWSNVMLKNYVKSSFRNLKKQPLITGINITGLAIGIASSFLILQYISTELSYDKFHSNKDSIFRIVRSSTDNGIKSMTTSMPGPADEAFASTFPEIVNSTKLYRWFERKLIMYEDKGYYIDDFVFSGDDFFHIFDFELITGNPETVLDSPNAIVLSEQYANLFFSDENPVGKLLRDDLGREFTVTGVFKNEGYRSHIEADALI